jgi:methionyl-tRNA formyltransferase
MRLIFMGTPDFGVPTLQTIARTSRDSLSNDLVEVITLPDRRKGRGRHAVPPPVKIAAEQLGIPVWQTDDLSSTETVDHIAALCPDIIIVVAFRILPTEILQIPTIGCINLHASLLPKYRGAAPINWAIINGERETGVSVFFLETRVDTGRIIRQARVSIGNDETYGDVYDRLSDVGSQEVVTALDMIADGQMDGMRQDDRLATRAPKLVKEDARIDWSKDAELTRNLVRGTTPTPGAWTTFRDTRVGILSMRVAPFDEIGVAPAVPGVVVSSDPRNGVAVATGESALWLTTVQPAGKRAMAGEEWVRGNSVVAGDRFE